MDKVKFFLVADGLLLIVGAFFFLMLYLRRHKGMGGFKDDIWKQKQAEARQNQAAAFEDHVDKKILLEFKEEKDPGEAPESTKPSAGQAPAATAEKKFEPARFRIPNFRGQPHEVLGVPATADKDLISSAYKHWIKRYHPDRVHHLGKNYIDQARRRAEQLNNARDKMLAALKK